MREESCLEICLNTYVYLYICEMCLYTYMSIYIYVWKCTKWKMTHDAYGFQKLDVPVLKIWVCTFKYLAAYLRMPKTKSNDSRRLRISETWCDSTKNVWVCTFKYLAAYLRMPKTKQMTHDVWWLAILDVLVLKMCVCVLSNISLYICECQQHKKMTHDAWWLPILDVPKLKLCPDVCVDHRKVFPVDCPTWGKKKITKKKTKTKVRVVYVMLLLVMKLMTNLFNHFHLFSHFCGSSRSFHSLHCPT